MILKPEYELTPLQQLGVDFLRPRRNSILGFKTGQGKSYALLATIDRAYEYFKRRHPVILFAPKKAHDVVWPVEIEKFTTARWVSFEDLKDWYDPDGPKDQLDAYDIIIVKYSRVKKYQEQVTALCRNRVTCYDEIHKLKNPEAQQTEACFAATRAALCRWGLSATTMLNSPFDLHGILSFLDPSILGSKYSFQKRYCIMKPQYLRRNGRPQKIWIVDDFKNLDHLVQIRKKYILCVESDVKVEYSTHSYGWSSEEETAYLQAAEGIVHGSHRGFAQRMPDLQRVVDGSMDQNGLPQTSYRSSKYRAFLPLVQDRLEHDESLLIFADYHFTVDMLHALLQEDLPDTISVTTISGKGVQLPKSYPAVIITTAGGSESLNLQFANHVFFYSIPFSVGAIIQMVGRITRMDSDYIGNLHAHVFDNPNNIDHYKRMLLSSHTQLIDKILGGDANLPKSASDMRKSLLVDMRKDILWRLQV